MAKLLFRKKTLLAKIETTYGVDSAPVGANAVQTRNLTIEPLNGEELKFDIDTPSLGAKLMTLVGRHVVIKFQVAAGGAGTAGNAPAYGPLLRACGYEQTLDAGVDATYEPEDTDTESVTMWVKVDRTLHKVVGCRGSLKMVAAKRQYPWFEFMFMGLFVAPIDHTSDLAPVYSGFVKPLPFRYDTVEFELGAFTAGLHDINIDFGQKIEFYEHSEEESIPQVDREATWQCSVEEPSINVHDFYAEIYAETQLTFSLIQGTTAGNIVEVAAPVTQLTKPSHQDVQGIRALQLSGQFAQLGSTPEHSIIIR